MDYDKNIVFCIIDRAPDFYWQILAEDARRKLEGELRQNQQVLCYKKIYINDCFFLVTCLMQ